jgi:hypothetical protein
MAKVIRMKRNRKGQFVAVGRSSNPPKRHKKTHRRNYYGAGAVVPMNPRKHHKRPPAEIAGIKIPNLEDTFIISVGVASGLALPPILQGFGNQLLLQQGLVQSPSITTQTNMYQWLVKGASYALPLAGGYWLGGRQGVKYVLAGELAGFVVQIIQQLASQINTSLQPQTQAAGYIAQRQATAVGMRGYTNLVPRTTLAALPASAHGNIGSRSMSRTTRFISPRQR